MDSKSFNALLESAKRLRCAAASGALTGREAAAAAAFERERLLAELRLRRERIKDLIRRLDGKASQENGSETALRCAARCHGHSSGSAARAA